MATANQLAANKLTSKKSTGPKSPEGKAKSSLNRLFHGFASHVFILPGENPEEFKALLVGLTREHQPATTTKQILVERMTLNQWLTLHAFELQGKIFLGQNLNGDKFGVPKDRSFLTPYRTSADRAFQQARNELVKAREKRKKSAIGFESQAAGESAGQPPAGPETQPKTVPMNVVAPDSAAECPASTAQAGKASLEICPETLEFSKNAA